MVAGAPGERRLSRWERNAGLMRHTYELYLDCGEDGRRFEALTCREPDLISEVQRVLSDRGAHAVDVHRLGQHLFTLTSN